MRDYSKVSPRLWTGSLGKTLRGDPAAQALAAYLVSGPHSNMTGLYHLPIAYAAADLGWTAKVLSKALAAVCKSGFAKYDHATERVWVVEHARHELGVRLEKGDKRVKHIMLKLLDHRNSRLVSDFLVKYADAFNLDASPFEAPPQAPSEALRSQEQEQRPGAETRDQEQGEDDSLRSSVVRATARTGHDETEWRIQRTWADHLEAWKRYFLQLNGREPSPIPTLDPRIRSAILDALKLHDSALLGADQRDRWVKESKVRAAGIGIYLSPWHTGTDRKNDRKDGGKTYLEHWRPWFTQKGKVSPVDEFARLYFERRQERRSA